MLKYVQLCFHPNLMFLVLSKHYTIVTRITTIKVIYIIAKTDPLIRGITTYKIFLF